MQARFEPLLRAIFWLVKRASPVMEALAKLAERIAFKR